NGDRRKLLEINGSSLRNLDSFINQIVSQHITDREATLFIDEIDAVNKKVLDWLLSVLSLSEKNTSKVYHDNMMYSFDFSKLSFLKESGPKSLTAISAKLNLDGSCLRRDYELFLLSNNLMHISGLRHITTAGIEVLEKCNTCV